MIGPQALPTGSASIREQVAALKFRSNQIDILEDNKRIGVVSQDAARTLLVVGGYEHVGNNTVKYLRRLPPVDGPVDGPERDTPPRAQDSQTISCQGINHHLRFSTLRHPWKNTPIAGAKKGGKVKP